MLGWWGYKAKWHNSYSWSSTSNLPKLEVCPTVFCTHDSPPLHHPSRVLHVTFPEVKLVILTFTGILNSTLTNRSPAGPVQAEEHYKHRGRLNDGDEGRENKFWWILVFIFFFSVFHISLIYLNSPVNCLVRGREGSGNRTVGTTEGKGWIWQNHRQENLIWRGWVSGVYPSL